MPTDDRYSGLDQGGPAASITSGLNFKKDNEAMTKSLEVISETVQNPKHLFRKVDNQPKKPMKHRYERRKVREYLHLGEWMAGQPAPVATDIRA